LKIVIFFITLAFDAPVRGRNIATAILPSRLARKN